MSCRCGWDGEGDHPCHSNRYRCRKPAKQRFYYDGHPFALAGMQLKFPVRDTFACDECWEGYKKYIGGELTESEWLARKDSTA